MDLIQAENLTAADIKKRRDEVREAAESADKGALIQRYIGTLYNAKARDELLATQGKTIKVLQDAAAVSTDRIVAMESSLHEANTELTRCKVELGEAVEKISVAEALVVTSTALAKSRRVGVAQIANICNPLLAEE